VVTGRSPLGACVRGPSAWIVWQVLRDPLSARIGQLERDPHVHPGVVRELRGTAADLETAAFEYRDWEAARSATDSVEVPAAGVPAGLDRPLGWDTGLVARELGCTERWVTTLCRTGQLAAIKQGRTWFIDASSVEDYMRGVNAA
jgi:hypothetical protein